MLTTEPGTEGPLRKWQLSFITARLKLFSKLLPSLSASHESRLISDESLLSGYPTCHFVLSRQSVLNSREDPTRAI